jgi:hypothetical protein
MAVLQAKPRPVSLLMYVTGHSFEDEEGIKILLNDQVSVTTRKNPYPLQHTLADLCSELKDLKVEVLNDCSLQPLPAIIKEKFSFDKEK